MLPSHMSTAYDIAARDIFMDPIGRFFDALTTISPPFSFIKMVAIITFYDDAFSAAILRAVAITHQNSQLKKGEARSSPNAFSKQLHTLAMILVNIDGNSPFR